MRALPKRRMGFGNTWQREQWQALTRSPQPRLRPQAHVALFGAHRRYLPY